MMLVRVKKGLGFYGHVLNGTIMPKNYASGAFEVTKEKGRELIARGIVDVVEGCICTPTPAPIAETPQPKTAEKKAKKAPKKTEKAAKKGAKKVAETAENVPTFDAMGGIE